MANRNPFALPDIAGQSVAPTQGSSSAPKIPTFDIRKPATDTTAVDTKVSIANIPDPTAGTFADFKPIDIRQTPVVDTLDVTKMESTPTPVVPLAPTASDVQDSVSSTVVATADTAKADTDTAIVDTQTEIDKSDASATEEAKVQTETDEMDKLLEDKTLTEKTRGTLIKKRSDLKASLTTKATDLLAEEEKLGLSKKKQDLQDVNRQRNQLLASLKLGIAEQENKPIARAFITGRVAEMKRQATAELDSLSLISLALQGDISSAEAQASKIVDAKYAPIEQEIKNLTDSITLNYQDLTREDQKKATQLQLLLSEKSKAIADAKAGETFRNSLAVKVLEKGGGTAKAQAVMSAKTNKEAIYAAGNTLTQFAEDKLLTPNEAATLGVPYGTTQKQAASMGAIPKAVLTPTDKIKQEFSMSKTVDKATKDATDATRQIGIMESGYKEAVQAGLDGKSNNAPSQAVLITFQKMLDPTSVVRESEYARSGDGQSVKQRMQGTIDKMLRGGAGVTQAELKNFYDLSQKLLQGYNREQVNVLSRTRTQAKNWKLNLKNIITPSATKLLLEDDKKRLQEYYTNNKSEQSKINAIIKDNPNISDHDVLRVLGGGLSQELPEENSVARLSAMGDVTITGYGSKYWEHGLDIYLAGEKNANVKAPVSGKVAFVGKNGGFGNQVKIVKDNGEEVWLSHFDTTNVKKGQQINRGAILGKQGNSGTTYGTTGVHVDVTMVRPDGSYYTAKGVADYLINNRIS